MKPAFFKGEPSSLKTKLIGLTLLLLFMLARAPAYAVENLEKEELKFEFIKLTDCAPLVIAYEKRFFEDEGLYVTLEAQSNWKLILDRVIEGALDEPTCLRGNPLGRRLDLGLRPM
jgi:nitrate/nitrite transport system substrate-binding protein